jgi:isopentenyl-diphosphate Delta-isomerase
MPEELVVLVDKNDNQIGLMPKMEAHEKGVLHRAFSVFVFNHQGEMLLHRRALHKYHSGGLWTNTCCSHPRDGETLEEAAKRRLMEEMGMTCEVKKVMSFIYKSELDKGLTEHEFDHVFVGYSNMTPQINREEVEEYKYMHPKKVKEDIISNPEKYTEWFKICFDKVIEKITVSE